MGKKYYAVARGRTPGIYFTWEDCKTQVEEFPGAVYKSFPTIEEAERFVGKEGNGYDTGEVSSASAGHLTAYVDGSYEHSRRQYAYGCVLVLEDRLVTLKGCGDEEEYVTMRNVAGEILGSVCAVKWAVKHGYKAVTIYYDYEGIEKWANGIWKANKTGTQRYKAFIADMRKVIDISFQKVAAHTGVKYNEMADKLAKEALGL